MRLRDDVLTGDGGGDILEARMRADANLVEYAPFVLILMALIELAGGSASALLSANLYSWWPGSRIRSEWIGVPPMRRERRVHY